MIPQNIDVVVADDQKTERDFVATILKVAGIASIRHALDGAHAWTLIQARTPNLVILDLEMPYDGITTLRHIRAAHDSAVRMLPVIMMTSAATRADFEVIRDAGAHEIVVKPIRSEHLLSRVENSLVRPRPHVESPLFSGPDRRRAASDGYEGPRRRTADLFDDDEGGVIKIA